MDENKNKQKIVLLLTGVLLQHIKNKVFDQSVTADVSKRTLSGHTEGEICTVKHSLGFKLNSKYLKFKSYLM